MRGLLEVSRFWLE